MSLASIMNRDFINQIVMNPIFMNRVSMKTSEMSL